VWVTGESGVEVNGAGDEEEEIREKGGGEEGDVSLVYLLPCGVRQMQSLRTSLQPSRPLSAVRIRDRTERLIEPNH
jgi:hypothetical protein